MGSDPSARDYKTMDNWRENGFNGNAFLIDSNNSRVTFYNEKSVLTKNDYKDLIRMGNQEDIK